MSINKQVEVEFNLELQTEEDEMRQGLNIFIDKAIKVDKITCTLEVSCNDAL